ncbi:unnamed protein product [Adineta steineri]|uniref:GDT1 family protein n=1 Tax=Adineta steineri TaxID=433720 RepID=A0A814JW97_9BILA|nr:unnamed protein product [Adineta steineri]CAF3544874.1 unnamed protein product [Adineta steineri]
MAITTRTLLLITFVSFSILSCSIYIYSKSSYKNKLWATNPIILPNGTKISANNKINEDTKNIGNLGFVHAFLAAISVIVVSEIGDKTFFIAAIMAMRHSRLIIYAGAMSALGAMTVLSALLGNIVTKFISRIYTYYLSSILFACFGIKMLKDGYGMSRDEGADEYEEVQQEVEKAEAADDLEAGNNGESIDNSSKENQQQQQQRSSQRNTRNNITSIIRRYISPIFVQACIMTFLAEWGDRSQVTTIVLAASENLLGVIVGGTIGHGLCTGLAVIGGRFIAQRISAKTVTLVGGVVFLCFALSAFFIRPDK